MLEGISWGSAQQVKVLLIEPGQLFFVSREEQELMDAYALQPFTCDLEPQPESGALQINLN